MAVLVAHSNAVAQGPFEIIGQSRVAKPVTIVAPEFPSDATVPTDGLRLEVRGTVRIDGALVAADVVAPPDSERFVSEVRQVLKWWRFEPAIDSSTCTAQATQVVLVIWFEGSHKEPRIFVSYPDAAKAQSTPRELPFESISAPEINYPPKLYGVEGSVRVLVRVEESGQVVSASILSSTPRGAFDSVVLASARQIKLNWRSDKKPYAMCAARTYTFCVEDSTPRVPFPECKR